MDRMETPLTTLSINGKPVRVPAGTSVAAAITLSGFTCFRHSPEHHSRAPLCGMGTCFECRVTINGEAHCRSCITICEPGMEVSTDG